MKTTFDFNFLFLPGFQTYEHTYNMKKVKLSIDSFYLLTYKLAISRKQLRCQHLLSLRESMQQACKCIQD